MYHNTIIVNVGFSFVFFSIFTDVSYRKNGLAVIHPTYIKACIVAEDMMDVAIGDYIVYPENLQQCKL